MGPSGDSDDKESACSAEDLGSIPGLGRAPGEGHGSPLQYSCPVKSMDRGAWWAIVHGVTQNQTRLSMHGFLSPAGLSCERVSFRQCVITGAALGPLLQTLSVCMPPQVVCSARSDGRYGRESRIFRAPLVKGHANEFMITGP